MSAPSQRSWWTLAWLLSSSVALATTPEPAPPVKQTPAEQTPAAAPSPRELKAAIHSAMRRESSTQGREQVAAIHDLLGLYREVGQARGIERDERLQLRGTIRSRLKSVATRITRDLAKAHAKQPADVATPPEKSVVLAQQAVPGGAALAAPGAVPAEGDLTAVLAELIEKVIGGGQWAGPGIAAQQNGFGGQPPGAFGGAGGAGRMPNDHGKELVELIEQTIAPETWEANGGQGTIVYFGPLQAIVVRQTDEVHENLGGLIRDLRQ